MNRYNFLALRLWVTAALAWMRLLAARVAPPNQGERRTGGMAGFPRGVPARHRPSWGRVRIRPWQSARIVSRVAAVAYLAATHRCQEPVHEAAQGGELLQTLLAR